MAISAERRPAERGSRVRVRAQADARHSIPRGPVRGYVALARQDYADALAGLRRRARHAPPAYAPALVGTGSGAARRSSATTRRWPPSRRRCAPIPSLTDLARRVDVLRFRALQDDDCDGARGRGEAGASPRPAPPTRRAIAASPDSAFLHRELGAARTAAGDSERRACRPSRRATELDASDAVVACRSSARCSTSGAISRGAEAAYRESGRI